MRSFSFSAAAILVLALALLSTPRLASAQPHGLAGLDYLAPPAEEDVVTAVGVPWLPESEQRYRSGRSTMWNREFRPGKGAAGLGSYYFAWRANENSGNAYLQDAEMREFFTVLTISGVLFPGLNLYGEAGAGMVQVKPAADSSYDPYRFGYVFGAGIAGGLPLCSVFTLVADVAFRTYENRSKSATNAQAVAFGGKDVTLRAYNLQADVLLDIELIGKSNAVTMNLSLGGRWQYLEGRFFGATGLKYSLPQNQAFAGLAGLKLTVSDVFAISFRGFIGAQFAPQATLSLVF